MKKFNKKKRNQVYRKALELFENLEDRDRVGLCAGLIDAMDILFPHPVKEFGWETEDLVELLPEFMKRKPEGVSIDEFWWSIRDPEMTQFRIEVFKQMIKETK